MCLLRDYSVYIATRIPEGIRIHVHDVAVTTVTGNKHSLYNYRMFG